MRILGDGTESSGCGGKSVCMHSSVNSTGTSLALQSTGKVVMVGQLAATLQAFSVRLTVAGAVDVTFQNNALIINELAWRMEVYRVVPQSDGSSIVVSQASIDFVGMGEDISLGPILFKILSNGTRDTSFGVAGYSAIFPSGDVEWQISDVTTQTDGKILIASSEDTGSFWNAKISISRVLPSGVLDSTFGTNGTVTTTESARRLSPTSIVVGSDGKILVTVSRQNRAEEHHVIYRYTAAGAVDSSFLDSNNVPGRVEPISGSFGLRIFAVNDKFMLTGTTDISGIEHAYIARINSDGTLDTSFNSVGYRTWVVNQSLSIRYISNVLVDRNGIITASGYTSTPSQADVLIQLNSDGSSRTQFGSSGRLQFTIRDTDTMLWAEHSMMLATSDGFILVGGGTFDNAQLTNFSFVARVTSSGQMNSTFRTNGVVFTTPDDNAYFFTMASTSTDQFLIGGNLKEGDDNKVLIMKMSTLLTTSSTTVPSTSPPSSSTTVPPSSPPSTTTTVPQLNTTSTTIVPSSNTTSTTTSSTTVPSSSPSLTTPALMVPVVTATKYSIDISISVSQASLLKKAKLTIPKGSTVAMKVSTPKVCRVVKLKVLAVSTGTCQVSLTVATTAKKKKTTMTTKTTSFKIM